jgi:glycosyltransferase involved in cell wall biosynthesis
MRYRPRRELTSLLNDYDLVQIVSGTPAWAAVARKCERPVVLQAATTVRWERSASATAGTLVRKLNGKVMNALTASAEKIAVNAVAAVLVENRAMLSHVKSLGQDRVFLAPPGVDTARFQPQAAMPNPSGYLLSVCRLSDPRKGLGRMIRAYGAAIQKRPDLPDLVLAGRGLLDEANVGLAKDLGLAGRIQVRSDVPDADLPELYQKASLFLQTSREEGLGMSLLEAMASGLPVVATETAGSAETVLDGETGWLLPQGPEADLVDRLAEAISRATGEGAGAMGWRGRARCVEKFSTAETLHGFTSLYRALLTTTAIPGATESSVEEI